MTTEQPRNLKEYHRYKCSDEGWESPTTVQQVLTERTIEPLYEQFQKSVAQNPALPKLYRNEHARFLMTSLERLSSGYECLDSSRPWLVYWILNAASVLGVKLADSVLCRVVDFLIKCRDPKGGFAGGPGQEPHLAPTYAAVNALCIIGTEKALNAINRRTLKRFLWAVREPNGAFRMHIEGELDVRGAYCAIAAFKLAGFSAEDETKLFEGTSRWISECQTYEGGFGGAPDLEAHGGYSFCAAAALVLLGGEDQCDLNALLRWAVNRQMALEGGFQGRTNKLVDACYSFWQGALIPIIQSLMARKEGRPEIMSKILFHRLALQEYVLICCQKINGGLIDKPKKPADLYHTCYALSGVAIAQHCDTSQPPLVLGHPDNELLQTHPVHNIPPKAVIEAYKYFLKHVQIEKEDNDGDDSDSSDIEMKEVSSESASNNGTMSDNSWKESTPEETVPNLEI
ncbi:protein farnesyltransferase subunit beta [Toxorhynchites rutilus septentrionalis]|uniref:protein farnesyltransferase subunit beta n=1 Tax=Toxorhynchites rutilus septentrionalis TaxID=329112 RepID=UPI00247A4D9C|nr:protein farnesyltransferase subunit beta [Toxorhynchites rutilus septentrionalis]